MRRLATRELTTHPAIKGIRYWATKGTFFGNVVFLENSSLSAVDVFKLECKWSPGHQRVAVHGNSTQKRAQSVEKPREYLEV